MILWISLIRWLWIYSLLSEPILVSRSIAIDNCMLSKLDKSIRLISITYCSLKNQIDWSCSMCIDGPAKGYKFVRQIQSKKFRFKGYIAFQSHEKELVIAFQGTMGIEDWMNDLNALMIPLHWSGTKNDREKIHWGFYRSYMSVRDQIITNGIETISRNEWKDIKTIHILGHSLGGAIASICGLDLRTNYNQNITDKKVRVVTLGQPRIGNLAFSEYYDRSFSNANDTLRIINGNDIIPHLPPLATGYIHHSREVWVSDNLLNYIIEHGKLYHELLGGSPNTTILCSSIIPEDPECSFSISPSKLSLSQHMFVWNYTMGLCE